MTKEDEKNREREREREREEALVILTTLDSYYPAKKTEPETLVSRQTRECVISAVCK